MICLSGGTERTSAAEATFLTSSFVISLESPLTAIIPWQLSTSKRFAGTPTLT